MGLQQSQLRYVVIEEDDMFVATCLEHYIGGQGQTKEDALESLKTAYRAELDDTISRIGKPFGDIEPAPSRFQEMWDSGNFVVHGTIHDIRSGQSEQSQPQTHDLAA